MKSVSFFISSLLSLLIGPLISPSYAAIVQPFEPSAQTVAANSDSSYVDTQPLFRFFATSLDNIFGMGGFQIADGIRVSFNADYFGPPSERRGIDFSFKTLSWQAASPGAATLLLPNSTAWDAEYFHYAPEEGGWRLDIRKDLFQDTTYLIESMVIPYIAQEFLN